MEHFVKKHKINTKSSMPKIHIGYANERLKENGKKQVVLIVYRKRLRDTIFPDS